MASEYRGISGIDTGKKNNGIGGKNLTNKHGDARWDRMGCQVMTWVLTF